jgi:lipopolysaccharide biosynthesis glycosyltransferase
MHFLGVDFDIIDIQTQFVTSFSNSKDVVVYGPLFALDFFEEKFLWLDADTLLLPDWIHIFDSVGDNYSEDNIIRAVRDTDSTVALLEQSNNQSFFVNRDRYFNSGVMIGDPKNWQRSFHSRDWQEIALRRAELNFVFNDQDVLNYLVRENVSLLSANYNQISVDRNFRTIPRILHFAGSPKPWNMSRRFRQLYLATESIKFEPKWEVSRIRDLEIYWKYEAEITVLLQESIPAEYSQLRLETTMKGLDFLTKLKHGSLNLISRISRE